MSSLVQLSPGSVFAGEFKIVRGLSEGGMGAVYVVEQTSTGKQRALKIMHPALVGDESLRARFVQEARIGAKIDSDHVVEVVAAGIDANTGTPWLAMELLQGETLAERVETMGPRHLAEVREVLAQLCHALAAAHRVGIVHRDLKPENIFLGVPRRDGVAFVLKVLDFGIAKLVAEAETRQTAAMGSPLWMAPEQADVGGAISASTDVWALGLLVFWMLTGKEYWKGAHAESPSPVQLLTEMKFAPLAKATDRAREYGQLDKLPPAFDAWFARCVTRELGDRFADAREARVAFEESIGPIPATRSLPAPMSAPVDRISAPPSRKLDVPELDLSPTRISTSRMAAQKTQENKAKTNEAPPLVIAPRSSATSSGRHPAVTAPAPPKIEMAHDDGEIERISASMARASQPPSSTSMGSPATARVSVPPVRASRPSFPVPSTAPHASTRRTTTGEPSSWWKWALLGVGAIGVIWFGLRVLLSVAERSHSNASDKSTTNGVGSSAPGVAAPVQCPPEMIALTGGAFDGASGKIVVDSFCMDKTEVTVKAYLACVHDGKCGAAHKEGNWSAANAEQTALYDKSCNGEKLDRINHPVNCVDATQADAYCAAMGKQLPTEAQWEWAARGKSERWPYPWGKGAPENHLCWSQFTKRAGTCAVGEYPKGDDPWGVEDLDGNVREWLRAEAGSADREYCGADWTDTRDTFHALGACGVARAGAASGFLGFRCVR